jgi:F-type H+-transporting ATPase subunit b
MNIDLFTLVAQVFNLIVLLFLLRKFLYLPVLKAVDARREAVEKSLKDAEMQHKKAVAAKQQCEQKMAEIEAEKQKILEKTYAEAEKTAQKLAEEAEQEFRTARLEWQDKLQSERKSFEQSLQALVVEHFKTFATEAVKQMAGVTLSDLIAEKLQEKIRMLPARKKQEFAEAYQVKNVINIRSAHKIAPEKQKILQDFLRQQFNLSEDIKFRFSIDESLVCGLAVQAEEQLISWNLAEYLAEFQNNMNDEVAQLINRG